MGEEAHVGGELAPPPALPKQSRVGRGPPCPNPSHSELCPPEPQGDLSVALSPLPPGLQDGLGWNQLPPTPVTQMEMGEGSHRHVPGASAAWSPSQAACLPATRGDLTQPGGNREAEAEKALTAALGPRPSCSHTQGVEGGDASLSSQV